MTKKLSKVEERQQALVDRMLDGVMDQDTFRKHNALLRDEAEQTKAEIRGH